MIASYYTLMEHFTELVVPNDMIEWWWVKDITDHTWEIRRLRRFKVLFVERQRDQAHQNRQAYAMVGVDENDETPWVPMSDSEKDSAGFFMYLINPYKGVDKLIVSAELIVRRRHTLREMERRRETLAKRLRKASNEIVDGEVVELPQAAE
jgi:hypothetical protein